LDNLLIKTVIGTELNLVGHFPKNSYPVPLVFGVEVLASALLMALILVVVRKKGLRCFGW